MPFFVEEQFRARMPKNSTCWSKSCRHAVCSFHPTSIQTFPQAGSELIHLIHWMPKSSHSAELWCENWLLASSVSTQLRLRVLQCVRCCTTTIARPRVLSDPAPGSSLSRSEGRPAQETPTAVAHLQLNGSTGSTAIHLPPSFVAAHLSAMPGEEIYATYISRCSKYLTVS